MAPNPMEPGDEKHAPADSIDPQAQAAWWGQEDKPQTPFDQHCRALRGFIQDQARFVKALLGHAELGNPVKCGVDYDEMRANIMLAYRHLEDARMRLGKAIQAYDGGTSCYDR